MDGKVDLLAALKLEIESNKELPLCDCANLVFGEGNHDAKVIFIGEAPGYYEDVQMRPFVGRAGKLLDKLLADLHVPRANVYITNIVKRRPPENRDPLPQEIAAYQPYLVRQIEIINPKVICTLGRFAMNHFLPLAKISNDHGKVFVLESRLIVPQYHPAAALRSTTVLMDLENDFKKLPAIVRDFEKLISSAAEAGTNAKVKANK